MTYLELIQAVASESGVIPGAGPAGSDTARPSSIAAVSDVMERRLVAWVADAWRDIQRESKYWFWMRREFDARLRTFQTAFSADDLGLERHAEFIPFGSRGESLFRIYDPAAIPGEGVREWEIQYVDPGHFPRISEYSISRPGKPDYMTTDSLGRLIFSCEPDAPYHIRGVHRLSVQNLKRDDDVPEMPEDYHDLIRYRALLKLEAFDEVAGSGRFAFWGQQSALLMGQLRQEQLPRLVFGGALA